MRFAPVLLLALVLGCGPEPKPEPAPVPAEARPRDGRTRVLYADGVPRWEYRYLKDALLKDGELDVHCWLASADRDFPQEHSRTSRDAKFQEPLAAFPGTLEGLLEYDVVILGNVRLKDLPEGTAGLLKAFVEDRGRGLVLIAGEGNMPDAWQDTALASVLPVEFDPSLADAGEAAYAVTPSGKDSPLTQLGSGDAWAGGLPGIQWARATRCKPAATALVELAAAPKPVPLFVSARAGYGRVFFSATDETWRWRFRSGDGPYFYPFWKKVIAWAHRGA